MLGDKRSTSELQNQFLKHVLQGKYFQSRVIRGLTNQGVKPFFFPESLSHHFIRVRLLNSLKTAQIFSDC